ncbi:protein COFACTOR ASSEMBLY OF COMPLEX C SUBUNIT B CCB4, chloroplastic [Silene latifolia]|uniref:protein COFACTOR ASSEMBLY OF COMPLEX C SUBUNIT B CCB4, chloroplastic n=1 Tax=Silene latifolia TaxID=37657 RepID=UPI003D787160
MEAGTFHLHFRPCAPKHSLQHFRHYHPTFPRFTINASSSSSNSNSNSFQSETRYIAPKPNRNRIAEWITENDDVARSLPIYVGGFSLLAVLVNRAVSGIAPVADAGSSQSRADLLALGLAVTNILSGLVWLSIRPKTISKVDPDGVDCYWIAPHLPVSVVSELQWFWQSLSMVTCCRSLVIINDGSCIFQIGVAAKSSENEVETVDATKFVQGSLYGGLMRSGTQSYLANLSLYPGKSELPFLPSNTQAVILQPLGDKGVAILGGDTIRGFSTADQAWIALIGDKLDATLTKSLARTPLQTEDTISTLVSDN